MLCAVILTLWVLGLAFLRSAIGALQERVDYHASSQRAFVRDNLESLDYRAKRDVVALAEAVERLSVILIYHDATVRGVNPESVGSTEELLRVLRHTQKGGK